MMIWDLVFLTKWLAASLGLCSKGFGLIKCWINLAEIFVYCNFVKPVVTLHHKSIVIGMEEGAMLFPGIEKF
jgi:hypothetical protein